MRRLAVVVVVLVLLVAGVADHLSLHHQLARERTRERALSARVAAAAVDAAAAKSASGDTAGTDELRGEVTLLSGRVGKVEDAAKAVCDASDVKAERARIDGADAASGFQSSAFYQTLRDVLAAVCGGG